MMDFSSPELVSLITKLLIAIILGAVLGLERSLAKKTAGMRTYALVSLGSALFVVIADLASQMYFNNGLTAGLDPLRIASQVIVGIGFIGAGTILRREDNKIEGTTTAASLWVVAAIGIASGFGFYQEAVATTVIAYAVLAGLWLVEKYLTREIRYKTNGVYKELKNGENPGPIDSEK